DIMSEQKRKNREKIDRFIELKERLFDSRDAGIYNDETVALTTSLLDLNPELYTAWNLRRDVLIALHGQSLNVKIVNEELLYVTKKLRAKPKIYWLWNYRKWLLQVDPSVISWDQELALVDMLLEADGRNFHGWAYRRFVIQCMENVQKTSLVDSELAYTEKHVKRNLSNYSAWFNRSQLISRLSKQTQDRSALFSKELELIKKAVFMDPFDESPWNYYRWVLSNFDDAERPGIVQNEIDELEELLEEEPDAVWCMETLTQLYSTYQPNTCATRAVQLLQGLVEKDPLRANEYKDLLAQ
ncbi:hypothetical protein CANCADRAFT_20487, partial [Tortispora caseinolytica NRRL Y-17796]